MDQRTPLVGALALTASMTAAFILPCAAAHSTAEAVVFCERLKAAQGG